MSLLSHVPDHRSPAVKYRDCQYPVSYTHLDVYKRQVKDRVIIIPRVYTNKPRTTGEGYKGIASQPDPEKAPDMIEGLIAMRKMPVSYTHLDVYKRQTIQCVTLAPLFITVSPMTTASSTTCLLYTSHTPLVWEPTVYLWQSLYQT